MELASPALEPDDGPSGLTSVTGQGGPGVNGVRAADRVEEGHVLVAVGVRVAVLERDLLAFGEFSDRGSLAFPPRRASCYAAGKHAVLGLELGTQDMLDTQFARHGLHLHACRGCRDDNRVAL